MERDYFTVLGLAPGRYTVGEIAERFRRERARLLEALRDPALYADARRRLDDLHLAYAALRDPRVQAELLCPAPSADDAVTRLRQLIAASLEEGLLRYSRRQQILSAARQLGFSEFQAHLLIAQVQFGDDRIRPPAPAPGGAERGETSRAWARFAAAGVLALAMFLTMVRWLAA